MLVEGIGMLASALTPAAAVTKTFAVAEAAVDTAFKSYDYLHERATQEAVDKVWRSNTEIRKYVRKEELSTLINKDDNYAHQSFKYSLERCIQLRIEHKEYHVTWNDRELGEFVRLGRVIAAGELQEKNFQRVDKLMRIGQARYILVAEMMFSQ